MNKRVPFQPKTANERLYALGKDYKTLSPVDKRIFSAMPEHCFQPITKVHKGDWLAEHTEGGQGYNTYRFFNVPTKPRNIIYVLPLDFGEEEFPIASLRRYIEIFYFGLEVKIMPKTKKMVERSKGFTTRINEYTNKKQTLISDIFNLLYDVMPLDAYCLLAVTMSDLYPSEEWK
jgi:archaemetzincin